LIDLQLLAQLALCWPGISMIRNYFKIAWRNLLRNRAFSVINISGLATGMAVVMLIGLWVWDEWTFDRWHKNYDRIAQVWEQQVASGSISTFNNTPFPIGKELRSSYAGDFKYVVMASVEYDHILTTGEEQFSRNGIYMDVDAPAMLTLQMREGTLDGLRDPHSILLSASTAKAMFGNKPPLNRLIKIDNDNKLEVKVTGVYEDMPGNTTFRNLSFIAPWDLFATSADWIINSDKENKWDNNAFQTFVQIADNADVASVNRKIVNCKQTHVAPEDKVYQTKVFLNPMRDWHLRSHWDMNGIRTGGLITYVRLFGIIGIFVLLLACINFMNLSTARSERRAREVGIRKTIGSMRVQIAGQFYSESLLVVVFAFVLSIFLVQLALPFFNDLAGKQLVIPYASAGFWLTGIGFTIITGLVAGSYPALYLSSFRPIKVLKGTFRVGRLASLPRKALVVMQFTISVVLVIGTIVVYKQVQYTKDRPIGYDRNGLMMIQMKTSEFYTKSALLRDELTKVGAIQSFAESSSPVTSVYASGDDYSWPGSNSSDPQNFAILWVTHDFGRTVGWQFKAGRDFSKEFATDSAAVVINETAARVMGLKDPIGKTVVAGTGKDASNFTIIGVIRDMLMESPFEPVRQTFYFMDHQNVGWIILKLNPHESAGAAVAKVAAVFKKYTPSAPFDYQFADTEFAAKFAAEERIGKLSTFFASLAIFISCLGLFGLASFVAEQRTKEIGVRKVLGASVFNVWRLLSKEFVALVLVALLVATPVSSWLMDRWLQDYSYKTGLSWWIFAAAGLGALVITLLTVSFQAIKAGMANPVQSLRSE
jgi:putative ABC transport system permease protein